MSLSIFTNAASMSSMNALNKSNSLLSTAMQRLGTGKRINSAADDAAGLQIATRLQGQTNGMTVAKRNIADGTAMLQTADGAFDEVTNIMYRMKDLATQAANDTNTADDRKSITDEYGELNKELGNIMNNTSYGNEKLLASTSGKLTNASGINLQIGSSAAESLNINLSKPLGDLATAMTGLSGMDLSSASGAAKAMTAIETTIGSVGGVRSSLGANINRLGHTAANLANMQDNTNLALGNVTDADMATEASTMNRNQMLVQTSMSMLKQSNSMSGMVMSLLN